MQLKTGNYSTVIYIVQEYRREMANSTLSEDIFLVEIPSVTLWP